MFDQERFVISLFILTFGYLCLSISLGIFFGAGVGFLVLSVPFLFIGFYYAGLELKKLF